MDIKSPRHIAVINRSAKVGPTSFAWMVAAVALQVREHVCPAWGIPPIEVAPYNDGVKLADDVAGVIYLVSNDGNQDSLGYHTAIGKLAYGFVDVDQTISEGGKVPVVLSHEVIEMALNQFLDAWLPGPKNLTYAREGCDPVEDLTYAVVAEILGQTKPIDVSDFITPDYFDESQQYGDFLKRVKPFEITPGGYQIAKTEGLRIVYLPLDSNEAQARAQAKAARSWSRTNALAGQGVPPSAGGADSGGETRPA